ncbi:MAG: DNA-processing protein DprA, partial [Candidatus Dormibacteria bacterium]
VVGARRCTPQGEQLAFEIAADLASVGVTVVSGLAQGIDGAAHRGAMAGGGRTVAVMGTGPDRVYPPQHRKLAEDIVHGGGALVTQFPTGTVPRPANFPERNEVIAALAVGVVVVEARRRSGAMHTAAAAAGTSRTLMACPGSVLNPAARGCHDLIRAGAVLVSCAAEVLEALADSGPEGQLGLPPAQVPEIVVRHAARHGDLRDALLGDLAGGPMEMGELCRRGRPVQEVATALARLRLAGEVSLRAGLYWLTPGRRDRPAGGNSTNG